MTDHERLEAFALDRTQIRRAFEQAAATYDRAAVLQREIATRMIERLELVKISPKCILDAGCGTGFCGSLLARRFRRARIVGVDVAQTMVRRAQRRAGRFGRLPLIGSHLGHWMAGARQFVCGDLEALPLATQSVDLAVSNLTLQWCEPARAFAELVRVLRPGGLLMFTTFGPDTLQELREAWHKTDDRPHVHAFTDMHDLGDLLVHHGFAAPVLDVERVTLTYPDVAGVLRELKHLGAHNVMRGRARGLMGKQRFARFRSAYESLAVVGRVPATYEVVYGHAWAPEQRRSSADSAVAVSLPVLRRSR